MPLAVAGSPAAEVIAGKQEEAKRRRTEGIAGEMSGEAPAAFNTSQQRPPYSRKDALPAVPQDRVAPPCNPLNSHGNFNTSYRQLKPTAVPPVRTMATVRSRGNGAAPIHDPNQDQFEAEEGPNGSAQTTTGKSPPPPSTPTAED